MPVAVCEGAKSTLFLVNDSEHRHRLHGDGIRFGNEVVLRGSDIMPLWTVRETLQMPDPGQGLEPAQEQEPEPEAGATCSGD